MNKNLLAVASLCLLASQGAGALDQPVTKTQSRKPSPEAEVRSANERYLSAMNALDVAALKRALPDDVVLSNNGTTVVSKAEVLAGVQSMRRHVSSLGFNHTDMFRVSVHDNCAVVTGQQVCPTKQGNEQWLFSNLFVWRNSEWQLVEARSDLADP